ncbi:hypothetical protein NDN16_02640 [Aureimonas altamirensis]|uniref:hypothetical protein n=1 Tax=Aureimonas altamirensis TaxID=370622 RepID=UPI002036E22D|nr:hypothetical protein [Aureimonas altamirensis]MCM2502568.1 hypothetical protein [Aureimonas altamirensis]
MEDAIDRIASIAEGSDLFDLRGERETILRLSQTSFVASLTPEDEGDLPKAVRAALAARMARMLRDDAAAALYDAMIGDADAEIRALADPAHRPQDARFAVMAARTDTLTLKPETATRSDVTALEDAGLSTRTIVSLTGLIAFVNYQLRVAAGLRAFRGH